MNARWTIGTVTALAVASALSAPAPSWAQAAGAKLDGKQIFMAQKCDTCHSISSAQIKATGKVKAPDLTGLAASLDAAWLGKFLRRQEKTKAGKTHLKAFTGSDEQMGALIAWLQAQKPPAKTSSR
jgi:mono/diheme cytochrome c family protein